MEPQLLVSLFAVIVSLASFGFARGAARDAARAEQVKTLLGEKETVGFGALKILRDGLPGEQAPRSGAPRILRRRAATRDAEHRELVIGAVVSACLFEGSDRARALLYGVVEKYRGTPFKDEFDAQYDQLKRILDSMAKYDFTDKELNFSKAETRLNAIGKILDRN